MNNQVEAIRQEIERLKKILEESTYYLDNSQQALGYSFALDDFKEFIDSLPDDSPDAPKIVSKDLEGEISRYLREECAADDEPSISEIARHFAEWQEGQMLKDAVEGFIFQSEDYYPKELVAQYNGELKHGDKVKIIIIKDKED